MKGSGSLVLLRTAEMTSVEALCYERLMTVCGILVLCTAETGSGSLVLWTADGRKLGNPVFWLTADDREWGTQCSG